MENIRGHRSRPAAPADPELELDELLTRVARGDERAFAAVYDVLAARVFGLAQRVLRDPGQAEEIAQEAFVDVWRTASRYNPDKGSAVSWVLTITHRRAVDRVRHEHAAGERERHAYRPERPHDEVSETVIDRLLTERVRRCLTSLTDLQRDSIELAYYRGYTYREVAELLTVPLGTIKTRLRDGLIRLRDCLGVEW